MTDNNKLILSGLLYEGNFGEWRKKMDAILKMRNMSDAISSRVPCKPESPPTNLLTMMAHHISPAIMMRLPRAEQMKCRCELWARLQRLCQPFRLLDLPAELREYVYRLSFEESKGGSMPQLASVCRQLRKETVSQWMSRHNFRLVLPQTVLSNETRFRKETRTWARALIRAHGQENMKHLRKVSIAFHRPGEDAANWKSEVVLQFSPQNGLRLIVRSDSQVLADSSWVTEMYVSMISRVAEQVEDDRQLLGLTGEAILLAMNDELSPCVKAYLEVHVGHLL